MIDVKKIMFMYKKICKITVKHKIVILYSSYSRQYDKKIPILSEIGWENTAKSDNKCTNYGQTKFLYHTFILSIFPAILVLLCNLPP